MTSVRHRVLFQLRMGAAYKERISVCSKYHLTALTRLVLFLLCLYSPVAFANCEKIVIGKILIEVNPPHEVVQEYLSDPWTNIIYQPTQHSTVESYITVKPGDTFNVDRLDESMRKLRATNFIFEAKYQVIDASSCVKDISVSVIDNFPFKPKLSFGSQGGESKASIGIGTNNLFGTGQELELSQKSSVLRDQKVFRYQNSNLGDEHLTFNLAYEDNDDGHVINFDLGKPFYELDSASSFQIGVFQKEADLKLYDFEQLLALGSISEERFHTEWARGDGEEWGFEISRHYWTFERESVSYSNPQFQDRKITRLGRKYELIDSNFITLRNVRLLVVTEDYNSGSHLILGTEFLYDSDTQQYGLGTRIGYHKATKFDSQNAFFTDIELRHDHFNSELDETEFSSQLQYNYFSPEMDEAWNAKLNLKYLYQPKPEAHLLMDESFLLRGFPYGYALGNTSATLNIEKRWLGLARFFDVFEVASVAFYDTAFIELERNDISIARRQTLQSIGAGLRISPTSLSSGTVLHINLSFPINSELDESYQLSFHAEKFL